MTRDEALALRDDIVYAALFVAGGKRNSDHTVYAVSYRPTPESAPYAEIWAEAGRDVRLNVAPGGLKLTAGQAFDLARHLIGAALCVEGR